MYSMQTHAEALL